MRLFRLRLLTFLLGSNSGLRFSWCLRVSSVFSLCSSSALIALVRLTVLLRFNSGQRFFYVPARVCRFSLCLLTLIRAVPPDVPAPI